MVLRLRPWEALENHPWQRRGGGAEPVSRVEAHRLLLLLLLLMMTMTTMMMIAMMMMMMMMMKGLRLRNCQLQVITGRRKQQQVIAGPGEGKRQQRPSPRSRKSRSRRRAWWKAASEAPAGRQLSMASFSVL